MPPSEDPYGALSTLSVGDQAYNIVDLNALEDAGLCQLDKLPYSIRILLEAVARNVDGDDVTWEHVENVASWQPDVPDVAVPFQPSRVVLQDLTGVPAVVDLAALRSEVERKGEDPTIVEPKVPIDLVIDHSVQVDYFGTEEAFDLNVEKEYERNAERYKALKWAQQAFDKFDVVPPGTGIVHQVNLEYLGRVVHEDTVDGDAWAYPDTLVGTDSHTPMIGGIGVVGWGVGGIDAESGILGQPISMALPEVVGVRLTGQLPEGATATDLVLHVTEKLRDVGVVDRFVEFFGPGLSTLTVEDRATIANMAPEQGSTISVFPPDEATLDYLERTGRDAEHIQLVREYLEHQGLFGEQEPEYTETVEMDLSSVTPSLAGPKEPDQRIEMHAMDTHFRGLIHDQFADQVDVEEEAIDRWREDGGHPAQSMPSEDLDEPPKLGQLTRRVPVTDGPEEYELTHGSVVVSAITSCTNTSNPTVMLGAGLLAKNAVEKGLQVPPYVKTSLAPGSKVVTEYLEESGLLTYLEKLGYYTVGYGCTTCIGNSGPLPKEVQDAIEEGDLWAASVLSGNRNFEARIHPKIKANYLASPPLVVAFGIAGRMDIDLTEEPLGHDPDGEPVFLEDIWPSHEEIREVMKTAVDASMFEDKYGDVFEGDKRWDALEAPTGDTYDWDPESTYIREPPFFKDMPLEEPGVSNIQDARVLGVFGDTLTTDHISPAGPFGEDVPAGQWLMDHGVDPDAFNTYGARRGNHEVMMRGTFANVRIKNRLLDEDIEGGFTVHHPTEQTMTMFEASQRYQEDGTPLVILAGEELGTGSSRDWAAKGTDLLGIKATLAASYERIYRDNCIGMGVIPLQFTNGDTYQSLGLDGTEAYTLHGLDELGVNSQHRVTAEDSDTGEVTEFTAQARLQTPAHVKYVKNGGVLHKALRDTLREAKGL